MDQMQRAGACWLLLTVGCGSRSALVESTSATPVTASTARPTGSAGQGGAATRGSGGAPATDGDLPIGGESTVHSSAASGATGASEPTKLGFIAADPSPGWADCTQGHGTPAPAGDPSCELDYAFAANLSESEADSVRVSKDTLFVLSSTRLSVLKLATDGKLTRVTQVKVPPRPVSLELDEKRLWVLHETGVHLYDVSNPSDPSSIAGFTLTDGTLGKARLRSRRLEVIKKKTKAFQLLAFEFDETRQYLSHAASPEYESVWLTEQGVWGKTLDAKTLTALVVESGPTISEGAGISLVANSLLGVSEANNQLRLVSISGDSTSIELRTYRSDSSDGPLPIGRSATPIVNLPNKNAAVRFDGDHAVLYAEDTSATLGVLDFSDPKAPAVRGELKLDGKVASVAIHGSALLAFEYASQGGTAERIRISQFSLDQPFNATPIDVKEIGPSLDRNYDHLHHPWFTAATFGEQSLGSISYSGPTDGNWWPFVHGLQLFRFGKDGIALLGQTDTHGGTGRRLLLEGMRLTAVVNDRVETFDITSLQAPVSTSHVLLEPSITFAHTSEQQALVRIGADPWTGHIVLDVTTVADADKPESMASITLDESFPPATPPARPQLIASQIDGAIVYVSIYAGSDLWLVVIDVSRPKSPQVLNVFSQLVTPIITHGSAFLARSSDAWLVADARRLDLAPTPILLPESPTATYPAPKVFFDGSVIVTSHYESGSTEHTRNYYLDRVDVSIPNRPVTLPSLNVPGDVLAYDAKLGRIAVYRPDIVVDASLSSQCVKFAGRACVDTEAYVCRALRGSLWLLSLENERVGVLDTYDLDPFEMVQDSLWVGERFVLVTAQSNRDRSYRLRAFEGFANTEWQATRSMWPSCWTRVDANARFVASTCEYPNGCGAEVFGIDGVSPQFRSTGKSRCGGCPRALTLAGSNLIASQPGRGVQVLPLD